MAALSADHADVEVSIDGADSIANGDVVASDIIYKNSVVSFAAAGGIQPNAADLVVAGIAIEQVDNSSGSLGDKTVRYIRKGIVRCKGVSGFARTDEGVPVYTATDNLDDLTKTATAAAMVGILTKFHSASDVEVDLNINRT